MKEVNEVKAWTRSTDQDLSTPTLRLDLGCMKESHPPPLRTPDRNAKLLQGSGSTDSIDESMFFGGFSVLITAYFGLLALRAQTECTSRMYKGRCVRLGDSGVSELLRCNISDERKQSRLRIAVWTFWIVPSYGLNSC